jgi:hypothetical protein
VSASEPPELPPGVDLARDDVRGDPAAAEARGAAMLATAAAAIIEGVEQAGARYVVQRATHLLDAWGGVPAGERAAVASDLADAATVATTRVVEALRSLLATDPAHQPRTPLEIVRTLPREAATVLQALAVPPIVRDAFEERALPDDPYGLAPRTLADLGDPNLGAMQLAWGVGKATVLRARAAAEADRMPRIPVENLSTSSPAAATTRRALGTAAAAGRRAVARLRDRVRRSGGTGTT